MTTTTNKIEDVRLSLTEQWEKMHDHNIMPCMEFEITDVHHLPPHDNANPNENDWLLVNLSIGDKGISFEFDDMPFGDELPVAFDGDIVREGDTYLVPFDECFDRLYYYIEKIHDNIMEGFLMPNHILPEV